MYTVEAGYALKHHESNRLIFLFEPSGANDQVPFDLNTYKYVSITQAAEIPNRLTTELESILQSAGAQLGGGAGMTEPACQPLYSITEVLNRIAPLRFAEHL
ncbi:MAG: hypothetical protein LRY51_06435 [Geovibrio sp.]|nr:hypothetical protein [Geovibrio sp.]